MLVNLDERQIKILQNLAAARHAELGASLALVNFDLPGGAAARAPIYDAQQRLQECIDALQNPVEEPTATVEDTGAGVRYVLADADDAQMALNVIMQNFELHLVRSILGNSLATSCGPFLTHEDARHFSEIHGTLSGTSYRVVMRLYKPDESFVH
jgi:hypothetical protein